MALDQIVMAKMNWADLCMLVVIAVSSAIGLFRGFVREAWSLFSWVVAAVKGWNYYLEYVEKSF